MEKIEIEFDLNKRAEKSKNLTVLFFGQMIYDEKESLKQNKPIFKNTPYIEIETGGNSGSDIKVFPVKPEFKERYKEQWKKYNNFIAPLVKTNSNEIVDIETIFSQFPDVYESYKQNIKNTIGDGTLIEELNIYPLSKATELKYYGYFFIEQILSLKEANDIITENMIEIAKSWEEKQNENKILKQQILELSNLVSKLMEKLKNDRL